MQKERVYTQYDSMSDLICDNYPMLLVMNRFGIDLGFGEESIKECCLRSGVDLTTFLAVVNLLISGRGGSQNVDYSKISLSQLTKYLHNSHSYFLEYRLPIIRRELIEALAPGDDVAVVIVNYYDEYLSEVRNHMMHEENTLFPYIAKVISGTMDEEYSAEEYSNHHDNVESKLSEFKSIIIKYYPAKTTHELNTVLFDIFSCEMDLATHSRIEDWLLVPTIKFLESNKS